MPARNYGRGPLSRSLRRAFLPLGVTLMLMSGCSVDDQDSDDWTAEQGDCDDTNAAVYPQAPELCDSLDNDCNGIVDDAAYYYADQDGDGYGDPASELPACTKPAGYVEASGDCNDLDPNVGPGIAETCDFKDNNCDGTVDEGMATHTYYPDPDLDGYGQPEETVTACAVPEGYAANVGDCDETNAAVNWEADEVCDGIDNDCDSLIDEGMPVVYLFPDLDGDGYGDGDTPVSGCAGVPGYSILGGDCDDHDPESFPSAIERCDGVDNNCNALVDDGLRFTWFQDLDGDGFGAQAVTTCAPGEGLVAARGDCSDADASVHPGASDIPNDRKDSDCGGTDFPEPHVLLSVTSSPIIKLALQGAQDGDTVWVGPGIYIDGDLSCYGRKIKIMSTHLAERTVVDSGSLSRGTYFTSGETSDCVVDGFTFTNGSHNSGGAVYVRNSSPIVRNNIFSFNRGSYGGAIYVESGNPQFVNNRIVGNLASALGGGVYVVDGSPTFTNTLIAGNQIDLSTSSTGIGGGVLVRGGSPAFYNVTLVDNRAGSGAGFATIGTSGTPQLQNSILAYNFPDNLYRAPSAGLTLVYTDLYAPFGPNHNLTSMASSNRTVEPGFVSFTNNGDPLDDDLYLTPASLLRDGGSPATFDPDGSVADMGVYGGSQAEIGYYADLDEDGLYDAWEIRLGLDPANDDHSADPDGDGLSNQGELDASTDPSGGDSDADGSSDGAEVGAGSDPLDWYSRPSSPNGIQVRVPGELATLQEAVDLARFQARILLAATSYTEALTGARVKLELEPATSGLVPTWTSSSGRALSLEYGELNLSDVRLVGNSDESGGAIRLIGSGGSLEHVSFEGNSATAEGGGLALYFSSPTLSSCTFSGNSAEYGGGLSLRVSPAFIQAEFVSNEAIAGGGIFVYGPATPHLQDSHLEGNSAINGGAIRVEASASITAEQVVFLDNGISREDGEGAGLSASDSSVVLTDVRFEGHRANKGAALFLEDSTLEMTRGSVVEGLVSLHGGGIYAGSSDLNLHNVAFYDNLAGDVGGAIYLSRSTVNLLQCTLVDNLATVGGGAIEQAYVYYGSESLSLVNSILAFNSPDNLRAFHDDYELAEAPYATAHYSDFYNLDGTGENLLLPDSSNLSVDPEFVDFDPANGAYDLHLDAGSSLIDAGDPTVLDKDGSRSDLGIYGGPDAP